MQNSSYFFPVLERGRMDYASECAYEAKSAPSENRRGEGKKVIAFKHQVKGNCLVTNLIEQGKAQFACTVVLSSAMYRKTCTIDSKRQTSVLQAVSWPDTIEAPMFLPIVVYTGETQDVKADNVHGYGLNSLWKNSSFVLKTGSIIARCPWQEPEITAGDILSLRKAPSQKIGFNAEIQPSEGGRIMVDVEEGLFDDMLHNENTPQYNSIITHMLSAGLSKLAELAKDDDDYKNLTNFRQVKQKIKNANLATWEDEENFNPHEVACFFFPHKFPPPKPPSDEEE